jgi:hypothetical protein
MVFEERRKWNSAWFLAGAWQMKEQEETQVKEGVLYVKRKLNAYDCIFWKQ